MPLLPEGPYVPVTPNLLFHGQPLPKSTFSFLEWFSQKPFFGKLIRGPGQTS